MIQISGSGKLSFGRNGTASVKCDFWQTESGSLRGTVLNTVGHPSWHPVLLLHPAGPYRVVMSDGQKFDVTFETLDGDVRVEIQ